VSGAKFRKQRNPNYEFISLKARQLHNGEAVALQNNTLLHPVMNQGTIKYSPKSEDN
jgi:hypothetical protein